MKWGILLCISALIAGVRCAWSKLSIVHSVVQISFWHWMSLNHLLSRWDLSRRMHNLMARIVHNTHAMHKCTTGSPNPRIYLEERESTSWRRELIRNEPKGKQKMVLIRKVQKFGLLSIYYSYKYSIMRYTLSSFFKRNFPFLKKKKKKNICPHWWEFISKLGVHTVCIVHHFP